MWNVTRNLSLTWNSFMRTRMSQPEGTVLCEPDGVCCLEGVTVTIGARYLSRQRSTGKTALLLSQWVERECPLQSGYLDTQSSDGGIVWVSLEGVSLPEASHHQRQASRSQFCIIFPVFSLHACCSGCKLSAVTSSCHPLCHRELPSLQNWELKQMLHSMSCLGSWSLIGAAEK